MLSGGTIRRYGPDDLVGRTDLVEHVVPTLPPRAWSGRPIVRVPVGGQEQVPLDDVVPRVADLRLVDALHAVMMVRAASMFSDALWVCDHDRRWPGCTASPRWNWPPIATTETRSTQWSCCTRTTAGCSGRRPQQDRTRWRTPRNRTVVEPGPEKKLQALITDFPPTAPAARPAGATWARLDWDDQADLRSRVETI
jgi:hypothetical protein